MIVDRDKEELPDQIPRDEEKSERKGEEARKELDEIPAHGTDPLHEGP